MSLSGQEKANICKWDGEEKGVYEVWYLIFHQPETGHGFWIRYTIHIPHESLGELPRATLWFAFLDGRDHSRKVAFKQDFPIDTLSLSRDQFRVEIDKSFLTNGFLQGSAEKGENHAQWDLRFNPVDFVYNFAPWPLSNPGLTGSLACSPNLHVFFTGSVEVNGETFSVENAPGCQTHIWGHKRVENLLWAHCSCFEDEPTAAFEALSVQLKRRGRILPYLTSIFLVCAGKKYGFNLLHHAFSTESSSRLGEWIFETKGILSRLRGKITCEVDRMVGVEYVDPLDGERSYCANSELADFELEILRRPHPFASWKVEKKLVSRQKTSVEFQRRIPFPDVPVLM